MAKKGQQARQIKPKGFVNLDKTRAKVMKEIWRTPLAKNKEIQARLKKQNVNVSLREIYNNRAVMRQLYPEKDFKPKPRPTAQTKKREKVISKGSIRLGTARAKIMKELWKTPRAKDTEIRERLKKRNVKVGLSAVSDDRALMKKWHPEKDFTRKSASIALTREQERMIPQFSREIDSALSHIFKEKSQWGSNLKEEFRDFCNGEIPMLIKNFDREKSSLHDYVLGGVRILSKTFVRGHLQSSLGIGFTETERLVRIIREKARAEARGKEITDAEIARKEKCSEREIKELWDAYQTYLRVQSRA